MDHASRPVRIRNFIAKTVPGVSPESSAEQTTIVSIPAFSGIWLEIEAWSADEAAQLARVIADGSARLLVGDHTEFTEQAEGPYANLVLIELDVGRRSIRLTSSLFGLPPVFVVRQGRQFGLTTPLPPTPQFGIPLGALDLEAAADVLRWGHPLDGRTMATNVRVLAPGEEANIGPDGELHTTRRETLPDGREYANLSSDEILDDMCRTFAANARRVNTDGSVVSLSGGLDSRATAVALLKAGHTTSFVTLAVNERALDARLAHAFCHNYGAAHHVVYLGKEFISGLPERVSKTAQLTYGVSALSQSIDHFMYEQLGPRVTGRVSGNLGNQVGRGGVESLTADEPRASMLSEALRAAVSARKREPWYLPRMTEQGFAKVLFQQEVSFWSIPNYVVGSRFAIQQSLYASRKLLALANALFARDPELNSPSAASIRARDLRHRIRGTPIRTSFQRRFLIQNDDRGRRIPINWGWLAHGGWSIPWVIEASQAALDSAVVKYSSGSGFTARLARAVPESFRRPYGLVRWPEILRGPLREFVNDTVRSERAAQSGAFARTGVNEMLDSFYAGDSAQYGSVVRALELACASQVLSH